MNRYKFSDQDKEKVKRAVEDLETVSCGEIVPYLVPSSDEYNEVSWYLSTLMGLFILVVIALLSYTWALPFSLSPVNFSIIVLGAMAFGFVFPLVFPSTKRWLVPAGLQTRRVQQRAMEAFLSENVFQTGERVGILIFVSKLEHQVLVLGDEGINRQVKQTDWEGVVQTIVKGIKEKRIAEGLVEAIAQCQELLLQNGFKRKDTDTNELQDDLRLGE